MTALVIGNGESRKSVDLIQFGKDYTTVGCNAIHRDIEVEHLVCCDRRMIEESIKSKNTLYTKIWVRPDWFKHYRKVRKDKRINCVPSIPYEGFHKKDKPLHWGSGPYAVLIAAQISTTVMLLGFDLYSASGLVNNVYKDTQNYCSADSKAVDHTYWVHQIGQVMKKYTETEFIVWNYPDWQMPKTWQRTNVRFELLNQAIA